MKGTFAVVAFAILTAICWGIYGPLLLAGPRAMGNSRLLPFIFVGVAYFIIAIVVPMVLLRMRGEVGNWTTTGVIWSVVAGAAGAIGALGIILAFSFGGRPLYVMPLVFGGAPVVNTLLTMYMGRLFNQISPMFLAGLIVVVLGAATVLVFKPAPPPPAVAVPAASVETKWSDFLAVALFIVLTAISWGAYGPLLHKGQQAMNGSRLRPFICVGAAYFLVAVLLPLLLLPAMEPNATFNFLGFLWSLLGGAAGAAGALGIIMAFNAGGKPISVMPLVFGGAPVVNAFTEIILHGEYANVSALFYAGMILVIGGAIMVLVFAPRAHAHPPPIPT
jgi:hypothetical protein